MKIHTIVSAIGYGAEVIASVGQGEQPPSPDKINKLLESIKTMLLPETKEELEKQSQKVKALMEKAQNATPFKVESVVRTKRGKGLK